MLTVLAQADFWDIHPGFYGIFFILGLMFVPRITLLFFTAIGGFWWWIGWIFAPRLTVAILATTYYWDTNPIMCVFAWLCALGGESAEKSKASSVASGNSGTARATVRRY